MLENDEQRRQSVFPPVLGPCVKGKMFHENKKAKQNNAKKKQETAMHTDKSARERIRTHANI